MSKELEIMKEERERLVQEDYADSVIEECDLVINALQRLESIDNANPSEAMKELEQMREFGNHFWVADKVNKSYMTIKQSLLKAQEPKKYLKWEDLKFTYDKQKIKVRLNGENYTVVYCIMQTYDNHNEYEYVGILKYDDIIVYSINGCWNTANLLKQFFNNLHLERVEE